MSRIGNNPLEIPGGVKVEIDGKHIAISGQKGKLEMDLCRQIDITQSDGAVVLERINESIVSRQMHGLSRSLVNNMLIGVSVGFEINMEIIGVGYKVEQKGRGILLSLGHSHQIFFMPPDGVTIEAETLKRKTAAAGTPNQLLTGKIKVSGIDKQVVGQVSAKIRGFRKPDVYKSKGIRYFGERVQVKAGKSAV
jgi:large subunit ribosomal protein L6